ncbi:MAG: NADH-quinone oxidoreductase subunit NuoE [Ignavibacteria bacterium]|nr:NADH-quinone oxidoreductase subunit NuoE [Ignavibacteria bacterium]
MDKNKSELARDIENYVKEFGNDRSALLPILQAIQKKYSYISSFAQQEVARLLDIHPVEVFGVISFYSFLSSEPKGKYIIRLCKTIICDISGKDEVEKAIIKETNTKFGETSQDNKFTLEYTNCLGMCDMGPAMMVNDKVYTKLTPEKVSEIISNLNN